MKLIIEIDDKDKETALLYLKNSAGNIRDYCQESKHYSDSDKRDLESLECIIKALENGTPYNPSGDLISREAFRKHYCKVNCGERQCVDHADRCFFIDELMQFKTEPERPKGEWKVDDKIYCSECGESICDFIPNPNDAVALI